ncbi:MAG: hypothetical protein IJH50_06250 [Kiritimatiellae bacterium]|nr:hypothetical protein [Kiritimatiellia bacterium]
MKIKVDVFKSQEDMKNSLSSWLSFNQTIAASYPSPAVGDEFAKEFLAKVRDEIVKNLYVDDSSQGAMPVNIACEGCCWDCKKDSFTVQLKFIGRHVLLNYSNTDDCMSITDCSTPNEIFYLKGVIER